MIFRRLLTHRATRALITWGPVALAMIAIFIASAQRGIAAGTPRDATIEFSGWMPFFTGSWDVLVKKSAHVLTYAALTLLLMRALCRSGLPLREASLVAILLALSYALTDELHQAFVPGRHCTVLDLGFDYIGATSAALARRWWLARHSTPIPPPESPRAPVGERAATVRIT